MSPPPPQSMSSPKMSTTTTTTSTTIDCSRSPMSPSSESTLSTVDASANNITSVAYYHHVVADKSEELMIAYHQSTSASKGDDKLVSEQHRHHHQHQQKPSTTSSSSSTSKAEQTQPVTSGVLATLPTRQQQTTTDLGRSNPLPLLYREELTSAESQHLQLIDNQDRANKTGKIKRLYKKLSSSSPACANTNDDKQQYHTFDYSQLIADVSMEEVVATKPYNGHVPSRAIARYPSISQVPEEDTTRPEDLHCHDDSFELKKQEQNRKAMKKLIFGFVLCFCFMVLELVGGYFSHSLAIFTDAAHLTSDLVGFAISLLAIYMGQRKATGSKSFGYHRIEVIGAFFSTFTILAMTIILTYFAIKRLVYQDFHLESQTMLIVSAIGLAINLAMMCVFSDGFGLCKGSHHRSKDEQVRSESTTNIMTTSSHHHDDDHHHGHGHSHHGGGGGGHHGHSHMNMNVRAAMLHLVGDIIQSVGVLVAAIIVHFWPNLKLADPICTLIFGLLVFTTTVPIISDIMHILMEGFPRDLKYDHIRQMLMDNIDEVVHVHSLHVWSLTHGRNVMAVHLAVDANAIASADQFESIRRRAEVFIRRQLHIHQTTIQVEYHQASLIDRCQTCIGPSL